MLLLHPVCLSFSSLQGNGRTCVGGWNSRVRKEPLCLWLQILGQVPKEKHKLPDRVRLPRSLFASLQGSRSEVRLAISVLDIGSGNLFKVRRSQMAARGSPEVHQAVLELAVHGVFPEDGDGGGDESLGMFPKQPTLTPDPSL